MKYIYRIKKISTKDPRYRSRARMIGRYVASGEYSRHLTVNNDFYFLDGLSPRGYVLPGFPNEDWMLQGEFEYVKEMTDLQFIEIKQLGIQAQYMGGQPLPRVYQITELHPADAYRDRPCIGRMVKEGAWSSIKEWGQESPAYGFCHATLIALDGMPFSRTEFGFFFGVKLHKIDIMKLIRREERRN